MSFKNDIEKFVIGGYKKISEKLIIEKHDFVLKDEKDNFISLPPNGFKYHMWASSLKSSQAFAYNVFSGVKNASLQFEFEMEVFNRAAQIDVKLEDSKTIELFEVKAFEICNLGINKIKFEDKYFDKTRYKNSEISEQFMQFLNVVIQKFENKRIYGGGIKQLCSHLLGIINIIDKPEYKNKTFKLYSFCFDDSFTAKFEKNIENYKETLRTFKILVDEFLKDIKLDTRVEYFGFLSAKEYIKKNEKLLGNENYNYVMKRYFSRN